jgi:hypothetical protein
LKQLQSTFGDNPGRSTILCPYPDRVSPPFDIRTCRFEIPFVRGIGAALQVLWPLDHKPWVYYW